MYQVIGAYFSPTGGTKRATETVCALLGEAEYLDLGGRERAQRSFGPQDLLVLALPVYAGQMPAVPGLLDGLKGDGTPCVVVATYGNRHYDDTLAQVQRLMEERGFRCVGAAAVITPHIFAPTLGVGRPDEEDIAKLEPFAKGVLKKLEEGDFAHPQGRRARAEGPGLGHLPGLRHLRQGLPHPGHGPEHPAVGGFQVHQLHVLRGRLSHRGSGV